MKTVIKKSLLTFGLLLCLLAAHAQTVSIPDTLFGNWLKSHGYGTCLTGNATSGWRLDTTCPKVHNDTILTITSTLVKNLDGIQYFVGLKQLSCYNDTLDSVPALPPNLTNFTCSGNRLTYLPTLPSTLIVLECNGNSLTTLPTLPPHLMQLQCQQNAITILPTLPPSLYFFSCANNLLTSLPALPDSLTNLYIDINRLTSLPALPAKIIQLVCDKNQFTTNSFSTAPNNVTYLSCDGNQLTTFPAAAFPKLKILYCGSNPLTELTGLPNTLESLICTNTDLSNAIITLPSGLKELVIAGDQLTSLPALPAGLTGLDCGGNLLTTLPVLPNGITQLYCNSNQLTSINSLPDSLNIWFDCSSNPNLTCLPIIPKLHKFIFNNTGITCLSAYPQDCDTSSPNIATFPLCEAGNPNACAVHTCNTVFSNVTDSLCPGGDFQYYYYHHTSIGTYIDTLVSTAGCDSIVTLTLVAANICPTSAGPNQAVCLGDTLTMNAIGKGRWEVQYFNATDIHGDSVSMPLFVDHTSPTTKVYNMKTGYTYRFIWISAGYRTIMMGAVLPNCVWPGDADANMVVDNNDLLPIGLAYDSTGSGRLTPGIAFQGYGAYAWRSSFPSGINMVNADCNGDGRINADDTLAITQNFSLTHTKTENNIPAYRSGLTDLIVKLSPDTVYAGDTLTITLSLGDSSMPATNVYGLAFTLNYDNLVTDSSSIGFSFGNSWFGNSTNSISISHNDFAAGQIKAAITGIDHANRSGYGNIATMKSIITTDNINGKQFDYYIAKAFISNITAIDAQGIVQQLNAGADSIATAYVPTGITELRTETIGITPNPAHDKVTISASNNITEITLSNLLGQKVFETNSTNSKYFTLDLSTFDNGLYMVQVKTRTGMATTKLVIAK